MKYCFSNILILTVMLSGCMTRFTTKELFVFYKDGLCGYIDYDGKIVVPPTFRSGTRFVDNVTTITDVTGIEKIMNKNYEFIPIGKNANVDDFHDGLAKIHSDDKWGYIDKLGKYVINKPEAELSDFSEGYAVVGEYYFNETIEGYDKRYYYIDKLGNQAFPIYYSYASSFSEGNAVTKQNDQFVIIDRNGKACLSLAYDYVGPFRQGFAVVGQGLSEKRKYGFIDKKGNVVIPIIYTYCDDYNEGYAAVRLDGQVGIINKKGKWIRSFPYDYIESPRESIITVKHNRKWGFVALDGSVIHEPFFDDIDIYRFTNGMARVSNYLSRDGMNHLDSGYLRKDGRLIWDKDIEY